MLKINRRLSFYIFILFFNFNPRKEKEMTILGFLMPGVKKKKREKTADEKSREREAEYYRIIDECAEEEKNVEIYHISNHHSVYVLKTIFMHAQNEVCIFTHGFNEAIFNDYYLIMEAVKFLKKPEARLKIANKNPNLIVSGEFLKSILNVSTKGKVEIWDASNVVEINNSYFWVNDKCHFARGPQTDIANFGNKEVGQSLTDLFIGIIIKSKRVLN